MLLSMAYDKGFGVLYALTTRTLPLDLLAFNSSNCVD
jgi:hypothetical protein